MMGIRNDTDRGGESSGFQVEEAIENPQEYYRYAADRSEPIGTAVVRAIAAVEGVDPRTFRQRLYDVVDSDALGTLVDSGDGRLRVKFEFCSRGVIVTGDGEVFVSVRGSRLPLDN